jgi:hypothetical protein
MKRHVSCYNCGCVFEANTAGASYCSDCIEFLGLQRKRTAQLLRAKKDDYIIEDGCGEFRPGARFAVGETREMLNLGYLPTGARLRRFSRRYVVRGAELDHQELERLED